MRYILLFAVVLSLFASCSNNNQPPSDIINREKMQQVLWDMFLAQSLAQHHTANDSNTSEVIEIKNLSANVFKIHGITEQKFTNSYKWYLAHPAILNEILDTIYSKKSREEESLPESPRRPNKPLLKNKRTGNAVAQ